VILKPFSSQLVDFRWARKNRSFLQSRSSPLEFHLHRSQYIRLLLSSAPPNKLSALSYANATLRSFWADYSIEIKRLTACVAYLPLTRLRTSPYHDLASPSLHLDLEPLFAKEYCTSLGMSKQVPLRVVGDIGGGGALARIEKGRKVMRERKSEWSQTDELPVSSCFVCKSFRLLMVRDLRSRSHCLLKTGTIQYLLVQFRRNNQLNKIHR
jgi:CTLH/CRA C-terminal to LisH motif domain